MNSSNNNLRDRFVREITINKKKLPPQGGAGEVVNGNVELKMREKPEGQKPNEIVIDFDNLDKKVEAKSAQKRDKSLESVPRDTVLKMLTEAKLDEIFIFHVAPGDAENYIQAMRQVLSRARNKARMKKTRLDEFKVLCHSIVAKEGFDEVSLIRTKHMSEHEESVYDKLIEAFKKED